MITAGIVVSTNDPQQIGRVKVVCTKLGDSFDTPIDDLPWARQISPFGGSTRSTSHGPSIEDSLGTLGYGMKAVPTIGTEVAVSYLDGDMSTRVYWGHLTSLRDGSNTLPHGRYMYDPHPALDSTTAAPYGPFTAGDSPIEPLFSNQKQAFGTEYSIVRQTRAADYQFSGMPIDYVNYTETNVPDDSDIIDPKSGWISTQGYSFARTDADELESKVVSITSPGFHSMSMDDRMENCRMRLRTSTGHQIIMDDTNERIYISTARGENWIEMDQCGNVDIFSSRKVSVHAEGDLNFTSDGSVRISGKQGVEISSGTNVSVQAVGTLNVIAQSLEQQTASAKITSETMDFYTNTFKLSSSGATNIKSGSSVNVTSGSDINMKTGVYKVNGLVQNNSSVATEAQAAAQASPANAFVPSRIPQHEPWPRTSTKSNDSTEPEFPANSPDVNRIEDGQVISRGRYWRQ